MVLLYSSRYYYKLLLVRQFLLIIMYPHGVYPPFPPVVAIETIGYIVNLKLQIGEVLGNATLEVYNTLRL